MLRNLHHRTILGIWLGWALVMLAYHVLLPSRYTIQPPDHALEWTATETTPGSQNGKVYLNEPFLNRHVAWDSEYYLAIAVGGYEDPGPARIRGNVGGESTGSGYWPFVIPAESITTPGISLSYAFFPFYPMMIRLFAIPLSIFGMNPIATASLAGVIVSMLGTLAAMLSLYELAREELDNIGGVRAAFYLLIFPSGFFLAEIYTEGLFVGLAFTSLLLSRRGYRGWAALVAVLATFTRAVGVVLAIPILISWIKEMEWLELDLEWSQVYHHGIPWRVVLNGTVASAPIIAFLLWKVSYYGLAFSLVEGEFFGRGFLSLGYAFIAWSDGFKSIFGNNPQAAAYYFVEWLGIIIGFAACIAGFKRHPDLAIFGFLVVFLSFASGPAQGMYRYVLAAPPVFLFLSRLGKNPILDRVWTIASMLLMGMMCAMYMFDMWAG
ncbi:MAG: hypothetical protein HYZ23_03545 [Chloroflexi bacterium]|nr:hypothetical protein [Chloroflexota bacterium]